MHKRKLQSNTTPTSSNPTDSAATAATTTTTTADPEIVQECLPQQSTGERTNPKQQKKEVQWLKPNKRAPRIGQDFQVSLPAFTAKK